MLALLAAHKIEIVMVLIVMAIIGYFAYLVYTKQLDKVQKWLLIAVSESEKYFGSRTGKLKLTSVYDAFVTKYPVLKVFVSFETFSNMVDVALLEMRHLLETNEAIKEVIISEGDGK